MDTQKILSRIPEYEQAQNQINKLSEQWSGEVESLRSEADALENAYQAEKVLLTPTLQKEREDMNQAKRDEALALQRKYFGPEGSLFQKRKELIQPIQDQIYNAVQEVAKKRRLDMVMDKSGAITLLYVSNSLDISDLVLEKWDTENKSKQTMNTRILSLVLALGLSMGTAVAQKIGHIAMDQLVQLMPETQAAQTEIEAYAQKLETDFQEMQQEYMNLVTDFQEKEAQMTKLSRDNKMQEIQGMQQRIEAYQQNAAMDLQQKQEELLTPIIEKANKAIQEVCVEEGFDYVLDSSDSKGVVLAINNSNDITPQVKQKLGI